jgi:hypothetical protein
MWNKKDFIWCKIIFLPVFGFLFYVLGLGVFTTIIGLIGILCFFYLSCSFVDDPDSKAVPEDRLMDVFECVCALVLYGPFLIYLLVVFYMEINYSTARTIIPGWIKDFRHLQGLALVCFTWLQVINMLLDRMFIKLRIKRAGQSR